MLFFPTIYVPIKFTILFIILVWVSKEYLTTYKLAMDYKIFTYSCANIVSCVFFTIWGVMNNTPGALRTTTVYIIYPIIYTYIIASNIKGVTFQKMLIAIVITGLLIGLYCIYSILYFIDIIPAGLYFELPLDQAMGIYDGFFEFRIYSLSSLIFIVPLLIGILFYYDKNVINVSKRLIQFTLLIDMIVVLLSARKGLYVATLFSFPIIFVLKNDKASKFKWEVIISVIFLIIFIQLVSLFLEIDYSRYIDDFKAGFEFDNTGNESAYVRTQQFNALINGWKESPWLGRGIGASASFQSSYEQPWAYELTYLALLFQIGIIGMMIITYSYLKILIINYINIKKNSDYLTPVIAPFFIATICFLIANATNPYLAKFDYLWIMFLPIATANYYSLKAKHSIEKDGKTK